MAEWKVCLKAETGRVRVWTGEQGCACARALLCAEGVLCGSPLFSGLLSGLQTHKLSSPCALSFAPCSHRPETPAQMGARGGQEPDGDKPWGLGDAHGTLGKRALGADQLL